MEEKKKLGEILLEAGVIDKFQLKSALAEQNKWGGRLGNHLVQMGILTEELLVKALSKQLKIPYLDLGQMQITKETLDLVPQELAEKFHLVPVAVKKIANKKTLIVAMSDPTNLDAIDELQFRTGHIIKPAVDGDTAIEMAIRKFYYGEIGPMQKPGQPIEFDPANAPAPANTNNIPTSDVHSPPEETFSFAEEQTVPEPVGEASLADLGMELVPAPLEAPSDVPAQYTDPMAYAESLEAAPYEEAPAFEPTAPVEEPAAWQEPAPVYDENGQPMYDANGQPMYDAPPAPEEAPLEAAYDPSQYDANGQPLYADVAPAVYEEPAAPEYDAAAQPAYDAASGTQYDANGQPVYGGPEATVLEAPAEPTAAPTHDENGVPYETAPAWDPNAQNWDENAAAAADPNAAATAAGAWDAPPAESLDALAPESAIALEGIDPAAAEPTVSDGSVYDPTEAEPVAAIDPETGAGLAALAADPEPPPPLHEIAPEAPPAWEGGDGAVDAPAWSDSTQPEHETAPVEAWSAAPVEPGPAEAAVEVAGSTEWNAGDAVRTDFGEQPAEPYEPTAPGEPTHAGEPATAEALAADGGAQEAPRWDPTAGTQPDAIVPPDAEALAAPEPEDPLTLVPFESLEGRAIRAIAGLMIEKGLLTPEELAARLKLFLGDGSQTPQ